MSLRRADEICGLVALGSAPRTRRHVAGPSRVRKAVRAHAVLRQRAFMYANRNLKFTGLQPPVRS